MTVVEYRDKFLTLSRYAPDETDTNEKRKERFLNGLHDEMQTVLVNIPFADLEALVDSTIQMEGKLHQANENRKRRMMNQSGSSNTARYRPNSSGGFAPRNNKPHVLLSHPSFPNRSGGHPRSGGHNNSNHNNDNHFNRAPMRAPGNHNNTNTAPRTGSSAVPITPKDKSTITCYECGIVGHYSNECPKRLAKTAPNTAAPAQQQRRVSTGRKFAPGNPNNRNGRLFHMSAEEAQEEQTSCLCLEVPEKTEVFKNIDHRSVDINKDLTYREVPIRILEEAFRTTRTRSIKFLKIQWSNHTEKEATWEREEDMKTEFPNLFSS
ncbi:hypothetical protein QYE76_019661 [Lolium multiflorum]|uniref:CCHC-type domain-containing protein n=1 Tax=Lolium multiflorum TaxID=4521 RepID=A0AAD8R6Y1_LOLMU|nr:hypothetical protein QYE76_019661 [Lolium multiflorum]